MDIRASLVCTHDDPWSGHITSMICSCSGLRAVACPCSSLAICQPRSGTQHSRTRQTRGSCRSLKSDRRYCQASRLHNRTRLPAACHSTRRDSPPALRCARHGSAHRCVLGMTLLLLNFSSKVVAHRRPYCLPHSSHIPKRQQSSGGHPRFSLAIERCAHCGYRHDPWSVRTSLLLLMNRTSHSRCNTSPRSQ